MQKLAYNIEYAHIYIDRQPGQEHLKSISVLKRIKSEIERESKSYVTSIMIDDYNPEKSLLNVSKFIRLLARHKAKPDFIIFESKLVKSKNLLLSLMKRKTRYSYIRYIETHKKVPCSFLIAIWYLKRLGKLDPSDIINEPKENFIAKKLINILPKKYKEVEKKARDIILSTKYKDQIKNIKDIFF